MEGSFPVDAWQCGRGLIGKLRVDLAIKSAYTLV